MRFRFRISLSILLLAATTYCHWNLFAKQVFMAYLVVSLKWVGLAAGIRFSEKWQAQAPLWFLFLFALNKKLASHGVTNQTICNDQETKIRCKLKNVTFKLKIQMDNWKNNYQLAWDSSELATTLKFFHKDCWFWLSLAKLNFLVIWASTFEAAMVPYQKLNGRSKSLQKFLNSRFALIVSPHIPFYTQETTNCSICQN